MRTTPVSLSVLGVALALGGTAAADPLDDLRRTLRSAVSAEAFSARIEIRNTTVSDDEGETSTSEATAVVDATLDPTGLHLLWPATELERARRRRVERSRDPEAPPPAGLAELTTMEAADLLDAAPGLLDALEGASLVESRVADWQGTAAQLLAVTPHNPLRKRDMKRVKRYEDQLRVWVGVDGWPLASERRTQVKAKFMLMGFTSSSSESATYGRAAGRLFCSSTASESSGEGMGQKGGSRTTITVTPVPAPDAVRPPDPRPMDGRTGSSRRGGPGLRDLRAQYITQLRGVGIPVPWQVPSMRPLTSRPV